MTDCIFISQKMLQFKNFKKSVAEKKSVADRIPLVKAFDDLIVIAGDEIVAKDVLPTLNCIVAEDRFEGVIVVVCSNLNESKLEKAEELKQRIDTSMLTWLKDEEPNVEFGERVRVMFDEEYKSKFVEQTSTESSDGSSDKDGGEYSQAKVRSDDEGPELDDNL